MGGNPKKGKRGKIKIVGDVRLGKEVFMLYLIQKYIRLRNNLRYLWTKLLLWMIKKTIKTNGVGKGNSYYVSWTSWDARA